MHYWSILFEDGNEVKQTDQLLRPDLKIDPQDPPPELGTPVEIRLYDTKENLVSYVLIPKGAKPMYYMDRVITNGGPSRLLGHCIGWLMNGVFVVIRTSPDGISSLTVEQVK